MERPSLPGRWASPSRRTRFGRAEQRAATSVTLNLAEGQRLRAGNQRKHYEIAHGSANEVKAALDLAEAWGWVADTEAPRQILDRQLALLAADAWPDG